MHIGFLLIDHGSRKASSNEQLLLMRDMIREQHPNIPCEAAHMEIAEPDIASQVSVLVASGVEHIHVLCYFLSNGRHITEDIPRLVKEALAPHADCSYDIASALGPDESLVDLLLKRSPFTQEDL